MKQPFEEEGHMPGGALTCTLWTEPNRVDTGFGSSAPSLAVRIRFSDDAKRLIIRVKRCTNSNRHDRESSDAKGEHREHRGGGWERWVREDGYLRRPDGRRSNDIAERCGGGGGKECSPSAGWREVAHDMHATEGASHR